MKNLIQENLDVLGLNSLTLFISFTQIEQILQITALCLSIIYTLERYISWKRKK